MAKKSKVKFNISITNILILMAIGQFVFGIPTFDTVGDFLGGEGSPVSMLHHDLQKRPNVTVDEDKYREIDTEVLEIYEAPEDTSTEEKSNKTDTTDTGSSFDTSGEFD